MLYDAKGFAGIYIRPGYTDMRSESRAASVPQKFLENFSGYLESDAYSGYEKLARENSGIQSCCCFAHARRHFSNAVKAYGQKQKGVQDTLAYRALEKISAIYEQDKKYDALSPEERQKRRQTAVKRRVDAFFAWVKEHALDTGMKDETYKGFQYCLNHEEELRRFLDDGEIPLDNNATEQAIRPFTVSRKTWKLIDTPSGAEASAVMYSLVETARANGLKIYEYVKYLLEELPKHMDDTDRAFLDDLLPWSEKLSDYCHKNMNKRK